VTVALGLGAELLPLNDIAGMVYELDKNAGAQRLFGLGRTRDCTMNLLGDRDPGLGIKLGGNRQANAAQAVEL
jgi:hypothetical protein